MVEMQRGRYDFCCGLQGGGGGAQGLLDCSEVNIQLYMGKEGRRWRAYMRSGCVCRLCLLFIPGVGHNLPVAAAARVAAHSAPALKEAVRSPLTPFDRWGLPSIPWKSRTGPPVDPSKYRWRRALLQVCVVPACSFRGVGVAVGKNGRDLHPIRQWRRLL